MNIKPIWSQIYQYVGKTSAYTLQIYQYMRKTYIYILEIPISRVSKYTCKRVLHASVPQSV